MRWSSMWKVEIVDEGWDPVGPLKKCLQLSPCSVDGTGPATAQHWSWAGIGPPYWLHRKAQRCSTTTDRSWSHYWRSSCSSPGSCAFSGSSATSSAARTWVAEQGQHG